MRGNINRQTGDQELPKLPPRFPSILIKDGLASRPQTPSNGYLHLHQTGRRSLHPSRKTQFSGQPGELAVKENQSVGPQPLQRLRRHRRGHPRMSIAVATYPSAKANFRQDRFNENREIKTRLSPSRSQPGVEFGKSRRKNIAEVMEHISPLISEARLFQKNFPSPPKAFQSGLRLVAKKIPARRCRWAVFPSIDEREKRTVLLQNRQTLRFRRMGGKDWLHPHKAQGRRDFFTRKSFTLKATQLITPKTPLGR